MLHLFYFQFLNHYFTNKAKFSYATVALKQRNVLLMVQWMESLKLSGHSFDALNYMMTTFWQYIDFGETGVYQYLVV
jgi:hypothetical protein